MRERFVLRDGVSLSYELKRHASPVLPGLVVLVHGRLHSSTRGPCALLAESLPFDVLSFDARGMGESEGQTGWNNVQEEVEDLEQLLEHASKTFEPPNDKVLALVGHSKGAVVALALASSAFFATLQSPLPRPAPSSLLPSQPDSNASTPSATPRSLTPPPPTDLGPLRPFVVSLSGRYDTSSLSPSGLSRFTPSQISLLESEGSFVWLAYRAGPSRSEKRDYVVTKEAVEGAKSRALECVARIPEGCGVLCLHGRADGTVPADESRKIDERIGKGKATGDLVLVEGVEHNWDKPGELEMAAGMVTAWLKGRAALPPSRPEKVVDHLGLERKR